MHRNAAELAVRQRQLGRAIEQELPLLYLLGTSAARTYRRYEWHLAALVLAWGVFVTVMYLLS